MTEHKPLARVIGSGSVRRVFQISRIRSNNLYKARFAFRNLAHHSEIIPSVPQFTQKVGLFDPEKIPSVIEKGERAMHAQLPCLKRFLESARP